MADPLATARAALEALQRDRAAFLEYVAPDFEGVVSPEVSAEPDSYLGHDGVRRYFALFDDVVEDLVFHPGDMTLEAGWVLADIGLTGRGRASGVPMEMTLVLAVEINDGKISRMIGHPDREAARAGIGT